MTLILIALGPQPPPLSDWLPEFIFNGLVLIAPWRIIRLARCDEWMNGVNGWIDRWMQRRPDHSVKYRQSLDYGSTGTAPQATNVCQCSQLQDQWVYGAEKPEDQHDTCFSFFSPCCAIVQSLHPSPPQLHRQSCQWGSSYPRGGCRYKTWKLQISKWRPLVIWDWFLFFFPFILWPHELLNWKCT